MVDTKTKKPAIERSIIDFGAVANTSALQTVAIQRAIDSTSETGGVVRVPSGTFICGTLQLRSHITLKLDEGAVLLGSNNIDDYGERNWSRGFIELHDLTDVCIEGPGTIDGADCANPQGEEGFRGPHCIVVFGCSNIIVRNLNVRRSANWAFNCVSCTNALFEHLSISGGHDGLDAMHCVGFQFRACEFRTGDDCIAGADNRNFVFEDCFFNTSCNAFRFSCLDLVVRQSRFVGPGEFAHKITGMKEMKVAFIHFSPHERVNCQGLQPQSDNWLVENCTFKDIAQLYEYDHRTLWQTGRTVRHVTFRKVTAAGLKKPITVCGDIHRQFMLSLETVTLAIPKGCWSHHPFVDVRSFDCLDVRGLTCFGVDESHPAISTVDGLRVEVRDLVCKPAE